MIRRIFSIAIICVGCLLEIYYYFFRFINDGIDPWLSIVIGASLTLLLAFAVFNRKRKWAWILMIVLVTFSVFSTSAGQSFSLGVKQREAKKIETSEGYQTDEIKNLISRREAIDTELQDITQQINKTVVTLEDRAIWRTTLAAAESRKTELSKERIEVDNKLNTLYSENTIYGNENNSDNISAVVNIYDFYSGIFGWKPESIQFILHTILSVFIAIMSPIGLLSYPQRENNTSRKIGRKRDKKIKRGIKKPISLSDKWRPWVERWVHANWLGVKSGNKEILSRIEFDRFCTARGYSFSEAKYKRINKVANMKNIVDFGLILCYIETEAIEKILDGIVNGNGNGNKEKRALPVDGQKDLFG